MLHALTRVRGRAGIGLVVFLLSFGINAEIPQSIAYQAILTDELGVPLEGTTEITFTFYDAAEGGAPQWNDTVRVEVIEGQVSVQLGKGNIQFPSGLFDIPLFLGIRVGADDEMVPRQALNAVGYAFNAKTLEGSRAAAFDQSAHVGDTSTNPHQVTAEQVGAMTPLQVHAAIDAKDVLQTVIPGNGLSGDVIAGIATLAINPGETQRRVSGACDVGQMITAINADGTVECAADVDTDTNASTVCNTGTFLNGDGLCLVGELVRQFPTNNTASGRNALRDNTKGSANTATGVGALLANTTGERNSAMGVSALQSNTLGDDNTATGVSALFSNTTGWSNTATGVNVLRDNTTGINNTASGKNALRDNTTGGGNTATGVGALLANTTGGANTASGVSALQSNTTGSDNTASGVSALFSNTTGISNTAVGRDALLANTTGDSNTAVGVGALRANTIGFANTASGLNALHQNSEGVNNTAAGGNALAANTTGANNTASGVGALQSNTLANNNTASGAFALQTNTTGAENTALGKDALQSNTTGSNNTASGARALKANTTGRRNSATGDGALEHNTIGSQNTATGYIALNINTTGANNTAQGQGALYSNNSGDSNTAVGAAALGLNINGDGNVAVGSRALIRNTSGTANTAVGQNALANNLASDNVAIGNDAGIEQTLGGGNIYIANAGVAGETNTIRIGDSHARTYLGDILLSSGDDGRVGIGTDNPSGDLTVNGQIHIRSKTSNEILVVIGEGLDYAEGFDVAERSERVSPGAVLVIDERTPGMLKLSDTPYDTKVAGIVAGANGLGSAIRLGAGRFDYDVALAGRVYCNVESTEYEILPGDLLTTSSVPGFAMKATNLERRPGSILGKAMQRLPKGRHGQILVLVSLQ